MEPALFVTLLSSKAQGLGQTVATLCPPPQPGRERRGTCVLELPLIFQGMG